jgi:hypothetical protein
MYSSNSESGSGKHRAAATDTAAVAGEGGSVSESREAESMLSGVYREAGD